MQELNELYRHTGMNPSDCIGRIAQCFPEQQQFIECMEGAIFPNKECGSLKLDYIECKTGKLNMQRQKLRHYYRAKSDLDFYPVYDSNQDKFFDAKGNELNLSNLE